VAYGGERQLQKQVALSGQRGNPVNEGTLARLQQAAAEGVSLDTSPLVSLDKVSQIFYGGNWNELGLHQQFALVQLDGNRDKQLTAAEVTKTLASALGASALTPQNTNAAVTAFKDQANKQFIQLAAAYANVNPQLQQQLKQRIEQNQVTALAEGGLLAGVDAGNLNTQDLETNIQKRELVVRNLSELFAQGVDALPIALQELATTGQMPNLDASQQVLRTYAIKAEDVGNGKVQVAYQMAAAQLQKMAQGTQRSAYQPTSEIQKQAFKNPDSYSGERPKEDAAHFEKINQTLRSPEGQAALKQYEQNILQIIDSGNVAQFQEALNPLTTVVSSAYNIPAVPYTAALESPTKDETAAFDIEKKAVFVYLKPLQQQRQLWTQQGVSDAEQAKRFAAKNLGSITHEFGHYWQNVAFLPNPEPFGNKADDKVVLDYKENLSAYNNSSATRALLGNSDAFRWYAEQPLEKHVIAWQKNAENQALQLLGSSAQTLEA
jgi:hypothetical protein